MLIAIHHTTRYTYETPARYAVQTLRLRPPSFIGQNVIEWSIIAPCIDKAVYFTDSFGNAAAIVACDETHSKIEITASGVVETTDYAGVVRGLSEPSPVRVFLRSTPLTLADAAIADLAGAITGDTQLARLHALMDAIRERIDYKTGMTSQFTQAAAVLEQGSGVCQDHAHVFIAAARAIGIPARYVNGYFLSGTTGPEAAHHAWAEAYVEHLGWVGFDVANLVCPDDRFVRLATGLDAATASPIRGSRPLPAGCQTANETLEVIVDVIERPQGQTQSQSQSQEQQQQTVPKT
jgi:transglutaminase-like putative cysteine protease